MGEKKKILICRCAERGWVDVAKSLREYGDDAVVVPDLCKAAQEKDPILEQAFDEVHACCSRAVKALFDFAENPLSEEVEIVNHRIATPTPPADICTADGAPAWYPVIDYSRCTNCGQCHEFCLFGVYEKKEHGKIVVANPTNCKNNCPACARICPETAIIFPKVGEPLIHGEEILDEERRKANVQLNVDEILGDDVYAALNARKKKRRSLLNKKKVEKALSERKRCSGQD